ncbi:MAG: penicillin-binding transpeptidase domain-containing protein [Candidatus Omnitrophota bacterium]
MYINNSSRRRRLVFCIFFLFFTICLSRLFYIQCFRNQYLVFLARKQQNLYINLEPYRGTIFDRNLRPLAINLPADSLYVVPQEIKDKGYTVQKLLPVLNSAESLPWAGSRQAGSSREAGGAYLRSKLDSHKHFVWIARKLAGKAADDIRELDLPGVYFIKESKRVYPNLHLASHLIGFAGLDNNGLEGIELSYDPYLAGTSGWEVILRDGRQERLGLWEKLVLPNNGYNLTLTVDEVIQFIVERELDRLVEKFKPKGASIVVMDPLTGGILALANRPTYDLNKTPQTDDKIRRNRAITDLFEPGSVFKIITASAALEESIVGVGDRFFCENGAYRVANHILHDHRPHGWLTFREIIEQSSNIGVTKVAQKMGKELTYRYIRKFGFGKELGIDLPGEIGGIVRKPSQWSEVSIGAVPFGQEVGVTVLQLASAVSVIANQGSLMKPYVVSGVQDEEGVPVKRFYPEVLTRVISAETASKLKEIMVGVVENGTGKLARIEGMRVAGKTGTAQKIEPNGRYSHRRFLASFIGFAPADSPRIAVAVIVDEPRPVYYGGVVCAPAFKNICNDALKYLQTQPLPSSNLVVKNETEETD